MNRLASEMAEPTLVERLRLAANDDSSDEPIDLLELAADRLEKLQDALKQIQRWEGAYPEDIFPKPDLRRARQLLEAGGMTLDAVSANAMRHVVEAVGKIAREALDDA